MRNIFKKLMMLSAIATLGFLYSCNNDDEDPAPDAPTLSISASTVVGGTALSTGGDVAATDTVELTISVNAAGGFNTVRITGDYSGEVTRTDLGLDAGTTSVSNLVFSLPTSAADEGSTKTVTITAVDDSDQTAEETFTFNVVAPPSPEARAYSAVLLVVPLGDFTGKNFFASTTGEVYSSDDVTSTAESISPIIDFGYYYGQNDNASIASPAGFESTIFDAQVDGWNTKNATVLKTTSIGASEFNEVFSYADIDEVFDAGTTDDNGVISNLSEGDVLAFETVEGKRGLILITEQNGTFNEGDNIQIDVLVQEPAE